MVKQPRYENLDDYCRRTGAKRVRLAKHLGVSRFQYAGLQNPELYPVPELTDELVSAIAVLLNQPESYVRDFYRKAAA